MAELTEAQKEKRREYAYRNPENRRRLQRQWAAANPEKYKEISRRWALKNRGYLSENQARRRAGKRCPPWVSREMMIPIYDACPNGYDVDHIVAFTGVTEDGWPVTGLHVPWNLQFLTRKENRAKNKKRGKGVNL